MYFCISNLCLCSCDSFYCIFFFVSFVYLRSECFIVCILSLFVFLCICIFLCVHAIFYCSCIYSVPVFVSRICYCGCISSLFIFLCIVISLLLSTFLFQRICHCLHSFYRSSFVSLCICYCIRIVFLCLVFQPIYLLINLFLFTHQHLSEGTTTDSPRSSFLSFSHLVYLYFFPLVIISNTHNQRREYYLLLMEGSILSAYAHESTHARRHKRNDQS